MDETRLEIGVKKSSKKLVRGSRAGHVKKGDEKLANRAGKDDRNCEIAIKVT